jgi:hypothetical protein
MKSSLLANPEHAGVNQTREAVVEAYLFPCFYLYPSDSVLFSSPWIYRGIPSASNITKKDFPVSPPDTAPWAVLLETRSSCPGISWIAVGHMDIQA